VSMHRKAIILAPSKWICRKGFYLVDFAILLIVLGIVALLGLPMMLSAIGETRVSNASGEIAVALEHAQLVAMISGGKTRVTVDAAADTVLVEQFEISGDIMGGGATLAEGDVETGAFAAVPHPALRGEDYLIDLGAEQRFEGVDIVAASFGGDTFVEFGALGAPSEGGTVTVALGDSQVILTVDAFSGRVTASE